MHLFAPHEPYENHPEFAFGERDLDRYDSEVRFADETVGELVSAFRARRPNAVVILTADHGEEFGEHGGHYHGTSVYEEQVRVPLIISAPGSLGARRIAEPVQTIDLLADAADRARYPQAAALARARSGATFGRKARRRPGPRAGRDRRADAARAGLAALDLRAQVGRLQALRPGQATRAKSTMSAPSPPKEFGELRARLKEFGASHGRYEQNGLRAEGKGWPPAILRGISGDGDAVDEIAALLDDADLAIRRKAAELLFELKRPEAKAALRLALGRDEDEVVRRYAALSLTRLGEGAPLTFELEKSPDLAVRRLAALGAGRERRRSR